MDLSKSYEYFQPETIESKIHIIGCGSVGSTVAENLVRMGCTNLVLWDFDKVERHNVVNQMFTEEDVGRLKVEALKDMLCRINPECVETVTIQKDGWHGKLLSGYLFMCVDNIELRQEIVKAHWDSVYVKAIFDFRTRLEDAQHYAADWLNVDMKNDLINSMDFTHDEAKEETPVSACNVELGVCPTVRVICALGVANFINFMRGKPLKKLILADAFNFMLDAF